MPKPNRSFNFMEKIAADAKRQEKSIRSESSNRYIVEKVSVENIMFNARNSVFNSDDTDEDIAILADSIESIGLLDPIHLLKQPDGKYLLLAGEKRTKAFKRKGWRTIPAFVFDSLKEYEAVEILYQENLQNRYLDDRKRFLAFDELMKYHKEQLSKDSGNTLKNDKIGKMLNISKRTVERLHKLRNNAAPDDMELLKQNKITFAEFKKRTNELISLQQKENNARIAVLAQKAEPKKYIDEKTNTVYYVGKDENENMYCSFMTNAILNNVGFHIPPLPYRTDSNMAQVDLDLLASNNLWSEYHGDLSEYKPQRIVAEQPSVTENISVSTVDDTENKENLYENINSTQDSEPSIDTTENESVATENADFATENADFATEDTATNYEEPDKNGSDEEQIISDDAEQSKKSEKATFAYDAQINILNDELPEEPHKASVEVDENIEDEKSLSNQICDFTGINLSGISVRGSLYSAPSGRVYVLRNLSFGNNIGNGKFEIRCIAEEVDPETIVRNDI